MLGCWILCRVCRGPENKAVTMKGAMGTMCVVRGEEAGRSMR